MTISRLTTATIGIVLWTSVFAPAFAQTRTMTAPPPPPAAAPRMELRAAPPPAATAPQMDLRAAPAPTIQAAPQAPSERMSKNPVSANPQNFDVKKDEKQKIEKNKNDEAALERKLLEKKNAQEKKEAKQKMYTAGVCKKKCTSDPCGCSGLSTESMGNVGGGVTASSGGFAGVEVKSSQGQSLISMQAVCRNQCSKTTSQCQASC